MTLNAEDLRYIALSCVSGLLLRLVLELAKWLKREFESERQRIIRRHIKAGHPDPLHACMHPDCQPLTLRHS